MKVESFYELVSWNEFNEFKEGSNLSTSLHCSLILDCGCDVISCLLLPPYLPHHDILYLLELNQGNLYLLP